MKERATNNAMLEREYHYPTISPQKQTSPDSIDFRVMELEIENLRLQRLVAELLLKNERLRKCGEITTFDE